MAEEKKEAAGGEAKAKTKKKLVKGRHKSAIKRHRQSVGRHDLNRSVVSNLRTSIKKVRAAVANKDKALAKALLPLAISRLHKAGSKGIIHHSNASRNIARLSSLVSHSLVS
ncbi:MAG: 30S ribosomal protein S20 [Deltaproteobacteria bacterium]|nr:30S ribosomal protein S20 [Deltaproteobacteria bacterium]